MGPVAALTQSPPSVELPSYGWQTAPVAYSFDEDGAHAAAQGEWMMLDSPMIDGAIGLVFFYVTLSLVCSSIQEIIASRSGCRHT